MGQRRVQSHRSVTFFCYQQRAHFDLYLLIVCGPISSHNNKHSLKNRWANSNTIGIYIFKHIINRWAHGCLYISLQFMDGPIQLCLYQIFFVTDGPIHYALYYIALIIGGPTHFVYINSSLKKWAQSVYWVLNYLFSRWAHALCFILHCHYSRQAHSFYFNQLTFLTVRPNQYIIY